MRPKLKLKPAFSWRPLLLGCHSSRTKTKKQGREADINITAHGSTDVSTTIQGDFDVAEGVKVKVKVDVDDQNNREKAKAKPSMDKQLSVQDSICLTYKKAISENAIRTPKLGILRLDYNYPPAVGDIGKWKWNQISNDIHLKLKLEFKSISNSNRLIHIS